MIDLEDLDDLDPAFDARLRSSLRARADLANGVTAPDAAPYRSPGGVARHRRRAFLLVAVAMLLVVAGVAALLRSPSVRRVDVVPATSVPAPPTFPDTGFVSDAWPSLAGELTSWGYRFTGSEVDSTLASFTFARRGQPLVFARIQNTGALPDDAAGGTPEPVTVGGHPGRAWRAAEHEFLAVAPRSGRSVVLTGAVERSDLEALAARIDVVSLTADAGRLPTGWTVVDDPAQFTAIGIGDTARHAVVGTIGSGTTVADTGPARMYLSWAEAPDPTAIVDLLASVWGGIEEPVGADRFVLRLDGSSTGIGPRFVWAVDRRHVAWLEFTGIDEATALATAADVRPAPAVEWAALGAAARRAAPQPPTDETPPRPDDGFLLEPGDRVIAGGAHRGYRWKVVTTTNVPNIATDAIGYRVLVLDGPGHQVGTSSIFRTPGSPPGVVGARDDRTAVTSMLLDADVADPGLEVGGEPLDVVVVRVRDGGPQLVFTVTSAIEAPDTGLVATDRGTPLPS